MVFSLLYYNRRFFFIIPYTIILKSKIDDPIFPLWTTFFTRIQSTKKNLCGCFPKTLLEKLFPETVNLPCDICNSHGFIHFEEDIGNLRTNLTFMVKEELKRNLEIKLNTTKNDKISAYVPSLTVHNIEGNIENNIESNIERNIESNLESNIESNIESNYESFIKSNIDNEFSQFFKEFDYIYKLEPVNEHSVEFQRIQQAFLGNNINRIHSIEKIHNPYLLLQYDLKKREYNKREIIYEEKRLFHGTKKSKIDCICKGNFNWRLTGTSTGHLFGQGVNFSPSASYCTHYGDKTYNKVMILASVIVSKFCLGKSEMTIPPDGYDTSIQENERVYVKYDDNTYYPRYLIHYESSLAE